MTSLVHISHPQAKQGSPLPALLLSAATVSGLAESRGSSASSILPTSRCPSLRRTLSFLRRLVYSRTLPVSVGLPSLLLLLLCYLLRRAVPKRVCPGEACKSCTNSSLPSKQGSGEDEEGEEESEERYSPTSQQQQEQQQQEQQQQEQQQQQKKQKQAAPKPKAKAQQQHRDKAASRLEWWQRLNLIKPTLVIPPPREAPGAESPASPSEAIASVHARVVQVAEDRLHRGKDWLVRDSDYGPAPAHGAIKAQVNAAIVKAVGSLLTSEDSLQDLLAGDPRRIILLLDTPQYGTTTALCGLWSNLKYSQQVVIPQADLGHYFEMIRGDEFYVGVRAQRLDHWLCANSGFGFQCALAFLDYECRLAGSLSARLCPAADVMRYFRYGFPMEPVSILAITVGLEEPASTIEEVDAFVQGEACLNGYTVELAEGWKYRMATLLYIVRRAPAQPSAEMVGEMSGL